MLTKENLIELFYLLILGREPSKNEVLSHIKDDEDILNNLNDMEKRLKVFVGSTEFFNKKSYIPGVIDNDRNLNLMEFLKKTDKNLTGYPNVMFFLGAVNEVNGNRFKSAEFFQWCSKTITPKKIAVIAACKSKLLMDSLECEVVDYNSTVYQNCLALIDPVELYAIESKLVSDVVTQKSIELYRKQLLKSPDIIAEALGDYILSEYKIDNYEVMANILRTALHLRGLPEPAVSNFIKGFEIISVKRPAKKKNDYIKNIHGVNVGGFWFSGSSAVYDFFRDMSLALTLSHIDTETPIVGAYNSLLSDPAINSKAALRFYFRHLLNLYVCNNYTNDVHLKKQGFSFYARALSMPDLCINEYSKISKDLIEIIYSDTNQEIKKKSLFEFFLKSTQRIIKKSNFLLLNQSPDARSAEGIKSLPVSTKFIATYRDPRDQYIDQINHGSLQYNVYKDVEGFIQNYKNDRLNYIDKKNTICAEYTFVETYFEDFITKPEERKRVCDAVGIPYEENRKYFVPEQSQKNMFKYKSWADQDAIRKIETELAEYLWQG